MPTLIQIGKNLYDIDDYELARLETLLHRLQKKYAAVNARIDEGEVISDATDRNAGKWKYGEAVIARAATGQAISIVERRIAERRKEQRIANHEQRTIEAQATGEARRVAGKTGKAERQKALAEHFVQVVYAEVSEPMFDKYMNAAKERKSNERKG